jgi:hypothetical protein
MTSTTRRIPLRGILGLFTLWITLSTVYMAWATITRVIGNNPSVGLFLLALCALFSVGIYLILARSSVARRYWLIVLSTFETIAIAGLFLPAPTATRQAQVVTLTIIALAIGYWMRSERVKRTFHLDKFATKAARTV